MKTWKQLNEQAYRIMLNCNNIERTQKGYIYYIIGGRKYKRSDLARLASEVAQKRYKLSRFEHNN